MDYGANILYAVDSGMTNISIGPRRICPQKILLFDAKTNRLVRSVAIPNNVLRIESLPTAVQVC